jgi:xylulokinase
VPHTLGIDLGTTGLKAGILNLATLQIERLASCPLDGAAEIASDALWRQTWEAISEVVGASPGIKIAAIGVAGQMHGAVLWDRRERVIEPILTWQERRRCDQAVLDEINQSIEAEALQGLGTRLACGYTGVILAWIKNHQPGVFNQVRRFGLLPDFIRARLLGYADGATDFTNAFGAGLLDVAGWRWHAPLIQELGLELGLFPALRESDAIAGRLATPLAEDLGLAPFPVVYGGGDNQVGMLGSGLVSPASPMLLNIGTAAQISRVISAYQRLPGLETRSYFNGQWALVGASLGGGGSYQWLRAHIGRALGLRLSYPELDALAAQVEPGAGGLVYCPGPSRQHPHRQAGFSGNLRHAQDPGYLARAVMEGVLLELYPHYSRLQQLGHRDLLLGGGKGLQQSVVWAQMAADLFDCTLRVTRAENVVLGAALLAANGAGLAEGWQDGSGQGAYREYAPLPENARAYRQVLSSCDRP